MEHLHCFRWFDKNHEAALDGVVLKDPYNTLRILCMHTYLCISKVGGIVQPGNSFASCTSVTPRLLFFEFCPPAPAAPECPPLPNAK